MDLNTVDLYFTISITDSTYFSIEISAYASFHIAKDWSVITVD